MTRHSEPNRGHRYRASPMHAESKTPVGCQGLTPEAVIDGADSDDLAPLVQAVSGLLSDGERRELLAAVADHDAGLRALLTLRHRILRADGGEDARTVDVVLKSVLAHRFGPASLQFRSIGIDASAVVLDHIVAHETVHPLRDRDDLTRRLDPHDRRCFALVSPDLGPEPLAFVEIALTLGIETSVTAILDAPPPDGPISADTAMFYAIVKCEPGLRNIAVGPELLHRAIGELEETTDVTTFCTLSPIPGLAAWADPAPADDAALLATAARFLLTARRGDEPLDPVARFHLGNGARLERLTLGGNQSEVGRASSLGLTANYVYDRAELRTNQAAYGRGEFAASPAVLLLVEGP
jgi:malonyl-CoA decarboxylase